MTDTDTVRMRITIHGAVQGVGFRPHVYRVARALDLTGWVRNDPGGVTIEVEGPESVLDTFLARVQAERPPRAAIHSFETTRLDPVGYKDFAIQGSDTDPDDGQPMAVVLPDIAMCDDCRREIDNPSDRRYRYPFTNCTNCGPRFTIIESLPYDRARTTMKVFTMCPRCRVEYDNPADRRFHAQPNACPDCGPHLQLWSATGEWLAHRDAALVAAAEEILAGRILAVKGLGGFHLMVDAGNDEAVDRLRAVKEREEKPFAVMFPSIAAVESHCELSPAEARLLTSPASPIVLLRRRPGGPRGVTTGVAPANPYLGAMLPYTPLHHLLLTTVGSPVVATSGNLSDEPICIDESDALERLGGIADRFLVHDRPILRHADDSIVRIVAGREQSLRRARGYAPLPVLLPVDVPPSLAVGGHLKNTVAVAARSQAWVSQHIGDLETQGALDAFERVIGDLRTLFDVTPQQLYCDAHPDYVSTHYARRTNRNVVPVQHHLAHVLSCLAENDVRTPALGVSWDGTGYGFDGTVWGGEWFLVSTSSCQRVVTMRRFPLPGGERAVREPRRSALGVLYALGGNPFERWPDNPAVAAFEDNERQPLLAMLERQLNTPMASSVGRLFDAVASLLGLGQRNAFEGQTAMALEFVADGADCADVYSFEVTADNDKPLPWVVDWHPMMHGILADLHGGVPAAIISRKFHNTLASMIVQTAHRVNEAAILLTGGCFQNRLLTEQTIGLLRADGFRPYWHQRIPPNDGGIALGQLMAAHFNTEVE